MEETRRQTLGEEIANSVSAGAGFIAALVALPFLVIAAMPRGAAAIVGASVFAGTAALLYGVSTLYHALPHNRAKRVFQVLDHSAIYLLIAGTYTPFALGTLRGPWGWSILGIVWGLAVLGVTFKATGLLKVNALSTALYLAMGWMLVIAAKPLYAHMPLPGFLWLGLGGAMYTGGTWFYNRDHHRYRHFVWHMFVFAGTVCHFVAVLRYSMPFA
jgi:hemolysin III